MARRTLDDPQTRRFLPFIRAAWADGDLTAAELAELRADLPETESISPWLDPNDPPTVEELREAARASRVEEPAHPPTFDVGAMTELLDGRYGETRRKVRGVLAGFTHVSDLPREAYRAQVRKWLHALAESGLGAKAYPAREQAGAPGLGEFIAVFETVATFDLSLVVKLGVQFGLFGGSIYFLGGEAQQRAYLPRVASLDLAGCFAMSELGHGSNVHDLETTARYDPETRTFEIHTPSESARKEWIGGAGHDARMATVFAQLEVEGKHRGVHAFLVPIRDESGNALPQVRLEDCGQKMGLEGVDNGRIWFDQVRVPRAAMLDRHASIDDAGHYTSPIDSDAKRFFTMLGTLVGGRVSVAGAGLMAAKTALAIAIRYGDRRRQFGPPGEIETLLNDYPTHQRRLMPLLAEAYALHFAHERLVLRYERATADESREIEALAAGIKAVATWFTTHAIQTARECCGGQGYLAENQFAALKADTDVFTTFEGDNTVLMQLVAKGLLTEFRAQFGDAKVLAMARHLARRALTALTEQNPIVTRRADTEHVRSEEFHRAAFRFREQSLVASVAARLRKRIGEGAEPTGAFVAVQNHLLSLARAYVERVTFESAAESVAGADEALRVPLASLLDLYALSRIEADLSWFLENGYVEASKARAIRKEVDALSSEVRPHAVALVDAFAIPLRAPIGRRAESTPALSPAESIAHGKRFSPGGEP